MQKTCLKAPEHKCRKLHTGSCCSSIDAAVVAVADATMESQAAVIICWDCAALASCIAAINGLLSCGVKLSGRACSNPATKTKNCLRQCITMHRHALDRSGTFKQVSQTRIAK